MGGTVRKFQKPSSKFHLSFKLQDSNLKARNDFRAIP